MNQRLNGDLVQSMVVILEKYKNMEIYGFIGRDQYKEFSLELDKAMNRFNKNVQKDTIAKAFVWIAPNEWNSTCQFYKYIKGKNMFTKNEQSDFLRNACIVAHKLGRPDDFFLDELILNGRLDYIKNIFMETETLEARSHISHKYIIDNEINNLSTLYGQDCMMIVYAYTNVVKLSNTLYDEAAKCLESLMDEVDINIIITAILLLYNHIYTTSLIRENTAQILKTINLVEINKKIGKTIPI